MAALQWNVWTHGARPLLHFPGQSSARSAPHLTFMSMSAQLINGPYLKTDDAKEFGDGESAVFETVFVLRDFKCLDFDYLYKNDHRIVGPPVLLHCAAREEVRIQRLVLGDRWG